MGDAPSVIGTTALEASLALDAAARPRRRFRINACPECIVELLNPYTPHHDPHPACTTGKYDHCDCTTCN